MADLDGIEIQARIEELSRMHRAIVRGESFQSTLSPEWEDCKP